MKIYYVYISFAVNHINHLIKEETMDYYSRSYLEDDKSNTAFDDFLEEEVELDLVEDIGKAMNLSDRQIKKARRRITGNHWKAVTACEHARVYCNS